MVVNSVNPILVLAGAAVKVGCGIFAGQLVEADTGIASANEVIALNPHFAGFSAVSVGWVLDAHIKRDIMYVSPFSDLEV
jgi:hypothetical protein